MEKSHSLGNLLSQIGDGLAPLEYLRALCESRFIAPLFTALGKRADLHIVGGTVRDVLAGKEIADIDLSLRLTPEDALTQLRSHGFHTIETGIAHGTITVVVDGANVELTTFRKPGSRESSSYSETIEEDLKGRDFRINAIAFSLNHQCIVDPLHGQEDLASNTLQAVGSAEERFKEDPLRILRMIRFGHAEGRSVSEETYQAAKSLIDLIHPVSIERIQHELCKILISSHATDGVRAFLDVGLMEIYLPEVLPSIGVEQNEFHIHDVYEHTLWVLDRAPRRLRMRLAALFHDLGKPATLSVGEDGRRHFYKHELISAEISDAVMKRMRFSKNETKAVNTIVALHMRPLDCGPSGVRRLIRDLGECFEDWLDFKIADAPPTMPEAEFQAKYDRFLEMLDVERNRQQGSVYGTLAVNGHDLIEAGLLPGKRLGATLKALNELVLEDPDLNVKAVLLSKLKELDISE